MHTWKPPQDRHERAWEANLVEHGHPSDKWFGTYVDHDGSLRYGQITRDWPECVMDEKVEEYLVWLDECRARQCLKAVNVADMNGSRHDAHQAALVAIKAIKRLPLDADNGNGYTWRDDLQTVVDIAADTFAP